MSFFFSEAQLSSGDFGKGGVSDSTLNKLGCKVCPLFPLNRPKVKPAGNESPDIYWIGDYPVLEDEESSMPFSSKNGLFLRGLISEVWASLNRELRPRSSQILDYTNDRFRFGNVLWTRTVDGQDPTHPEIECCRNQVLEDIERTKPKIVIGLGNTALRWFLRDSGIQAWRGRRVPIRIGNHECWFFPLYHPKEVVLRNESVSFRDTVSDEELVFRRDIGRIFRFLLNDYEDPNPEPENKIFDNIQIFTGRDPRDLKRLEQAFSRISDFDEIAVDIETSSEESVKFRKMLPMGRGSKILSVALGTYDFTFAFALDHPQSGWNNSDKSVIRTWLKDLLTNSNISKIAHNLSFELAWFVHEYGYDWVYDTKWHDTQAQTYIIYGLGDSNKSKSLQSLDSLCLHYFGFNLKSFSNLSRDSLDMEDLENVLKYNAGDTKYTHKLYQIQNEILEDQGKIGVYDHQVLRAVSTALMTYFGVRVDQPKVNELSKKLESESRIIAKKIDLMEEVQEFSRRYGRPFNPGSDQDCSLMFGDILGFRDEITLPNGRKSVDKEALGRITHELAKLVVNRREILKLLSTYVAPMKAENRMNVWDDGKMHPRYNTTFVTTRRLSSDGPNIQNYPKRRNSHIRATVVPKDGYWMVAADYGSFEARVIAMASGDENLVGSMWNGHDIHGEWAHKFIERYPGILDRAVKTSNSSDDEEIFKMVRHFSKNEFVFPSFYGAGVKSISANMKIPLEIVTELQEEFWGKYPGVRAWHQKVKNQYREDGYVELLTGFRRYAPISRPNAIINSLVQGTAADMAIDALNRLSLDSIRMKKRHLHPIMCIHDDLTFEIPKATFDDDVEYIIDSMLSCPFDFINVPMVVEVTAGKNWYEMKPVGEFNDAHRREKPSFIKTKEILK